MTPLPAWFEECRACPDTDDRVFKALSIAWKALEKSRTHDGSIGSIHRLAAEAMREIQELEKS